MYTRYEFDTNNGNLFARRIIYSSTYACTIPHQTKSWATAELTWSCPLLDIRVDGWTTLSCTSGLFMIKPQDTV